MKSSAFGALIITGGGWPGAYDIVRALGREGVCCAVASSQEDEIAFSSRYVRRRLALPSFIPSNFDTMANLLINFAMDFDDPPVLFYVGDSELHFVSRFADQLRPYYRFLLPPDDVLRDVCDKGLFPGLAARYELPIPSTRRFATIDELQLSMASIELPCIVKPVFNRDWFGENKPVQRGFGSYKEALRKFETKEDLARFCVELPYRTTPLIVQRYIEGAESSVVSFNGYFDKNSDCLGHLTGREIRTNPPINGESACSETIVDDTLALRSIEYLQRMNFRGIVKIDYKWDATDQAFTIMEIEPHYQFWALLGSYAGVNLAYIAYRSQRGEPVQPSYSSAAGEQMLYLKHDLIAYLRGYRKTGQWPARAYLKTLFRKQHYRVLDPRDPLPFVSSCSGFVRKIVRRTFSHG